MKRSIDLWMPLHLGDVSSEAAHMTNEEFGAYMRLLLAAWPREGVLPDNEAWLARMARCTQKRWSQISSVVLEPFHRVDLDLIHDRLMGERTKAENTSAERRLAAEKRWSKRNANADANAMPRAVNVDVTVSREESHRLKEGLPRERNNLSEGTTSRGATVRLVSGDGL